MVVELLYNTKRKLVRIKNVYIYISIGLRVTQSFSSEHVPIQSHFLSHIWSGERHILYASHFNVQAAKFNLIID